MVDKKQKYMVKKGMGIINQTIVNDAKKNNLVVYGMRSVEKQAPAMLHGRTTEDYDIYNKTPHKAAHRVEKKLDRNFGGDFFYVTPAEHPGTYKVMTRMEQNQYGGDKNVADYTKSVKHTKSKRIGGVRYSTMTHEEKNKRKSLRDPASQFRHGKDRSDLKIIKSGQNFRRGYNPKKKKRGVKKWLF